MTASELFKEVRRLDANGYTDIKMSVDGGGAFKIRYNGQDVDSAECLNILDDLLEERGYIYARFASSRSADLPEIELHVREERQVGDLSIVRVELDEDGIVLYSHVLGE